VLGAFIAMTVLILDIFTAITAMKLDRTPGATAADFF
jgi:hypothetical protein